MESVGMDRNFFKARFASKEEAEKAKPFIGGFSGEVLKETILIFDTAIEWTPEADYESKKTGLAKLTDAEKKALGL